jgi:hypothetical protein
VREETAVVEGDWLRIGIVRCRAASPSARHPRAARRRCSTPLHPRCRPEPPGELRPALVSLPRRAGLADAPGSRKSFGTMQDSPALAVAIGPESRRRLRACGR